MEDPGSRLENSKAGCHPARQIQIFFGSAEVTCYPMGGFGVAMMGVMEGGKRAHSPHPKPALQSNQNWHSMAELVRGEARGSNSHTCRLPTQ